VPKRTKFKVGQVLLWTNGCCNTESPQQQARYVKVVRVAARARGFESLPGVPLRGQCDQTLYEVLETESSTFFASENKLRRLRVREIG